MSTWTNSLTSQHYGTIDGTRVLVERWGDGSVTISTKPPGVRTWGPPVELTELALVQFLGGAS